MKVGINIQSYVDVITNSSTTVFCSIESDFETIIQNIEDYLNSFLPFKVNIIDRVLLKHIQLHLRWNMEKMKNLLKIYVH